MSETSARPGEITVMPVGVLSKGETFLCDWARESYKESVPTFNDVLAKVLTLSTALAGGGLALLDKVTMPGWGKGAMLSLFLSGIVSCLFGLFPYGGTLVMSAPIIRERVKNTIHRKSLCLFAASVSLALGFAVGLTSLAFNPSPVEPVTPQFGR